MARRLTLIAGSGTLVPYIAAAARTGFDAVQIVDLVGRNDLEADRVLHTPLSDATGVINAVKSFKTTHAILAGAVHISDSEREGLARAFGLAGRMAGSLGDVGLAGMILLYSRMTGVKLIGAHDVAPDLLAAEGPIAGPALDAATLAAARTALAAAREIGRIDLGQSIVFSGDRPLAAEDAGGTDALLARVKDLRDRGLAGSGSARLVLAKAVKPKQPKFVDLPTIGAQTVERAAEAGITVIAVEAGRTLVLDRSGLVDAAARLGVSVVGLRAGRG